MVLFPELDLRVVCERRFMRGKKKSPSAMDGLYEKNGDVGLDAA
jgi:hypothetical protein